MWFLSTILAKTIKLLVILFRAGTGNTLPGKIVLKIFPNILSQFHCKVGTILISGTNGKTTTTKLLAHLLKKNDFTVVTNESGSNLLRGLTSTLLLNTNITGKPSGDIAVLEVDEFTLPEVLEYVTPSVLVLLNLSRDQLDRYGEVDIVFDRWVQAIQKLSIDTVLSIYEGQEEFKRIEGIFEGSVVAFDSDKVLLDNSPLHGDFNAKNINAAVSVLSILNINTQNISEHLSDFGTAYGRGELISKKSQNYRIFLAKNPASFNNNLELLLGGNVTADSILFILNDNIPDGRDVSWIYDIDPSLLYMACSGKRIFVSGTRAHDMLLRLKYAGVSVDEKSVISYKNLNNLGENVVILPNYSAMLDVRKALLGRKIL
jgi:UDP-N-acetylmuramyl tripeptide synthase